MIADVITGKHLCHDIIELANGYTNASDAYTQWANDLGVSPTTSLPGLINSDDACIEIDAGFIYALDGVTSKLMQSTEGSIGFYIEDPLGTLGNNARPITAITTEQRNVTRAYTSRSSVNPSFIINCKNPTQDSQSYNGKWQKTYDTLILFIRWAQYGNANLNNVDVALRLSKGSIEVVCTPFASTIFFQCFLMNSTNNSGQALAGNGSFGKALTINTTYTFKSALPAIISGNVLGDDGLPVSTKVRAYNRETGFLTGEAISDANGDYSIQLYSTDPQYIVCLPGNNSELNALINDRVIPVE